MPRALWLLLSLRFRAWLRRLGRNAGTVRGALFLAAGLLFFALIVGPNIIFRVFQGDHGLGSPVSVERIRQVGPLLLFGYCAMTVLFASAEQGVSFTPAEVQFLFSGPFSRRQVLAYKIVGNVLLSGLYALFLTGLVLAYAARPVFAYPGLVLMLWFVLLFNMAVSMALNTIGARAFDRPRKLALLIVVGLAAWGIARLGGDAFAQGPSAVAARLEQHQVVQVLVTPMRWFVETFTAERLWPDFVLGALRCLAVDIVLLVFVFALDAQYLEASAAASERVYARLQRMRSGGAMAAHVATGRPRFRVPSLPRWGGVGPLAWRQLTTAVRSLRPVLIFLVVFGVVVGGSRLALGAVAQDEPALGGWVIGSTVLGMTIAMLTPLLTFDFRGDIDRMDLLKALPLPSWRVALGQLLAPALVLSTVQLLVMGFVQFLWGGVELLFYGVVLFALPFNFLSFGLENLMFLWFPARPTPTAPGDFQMMGRQTLMMLAKMALLGLVMVPAAVAGTIAYVVATLAFEVNGTPAGLAVGWLVLTGLSSVVVPLVASAFRRFDVARDTPP